LIKEGTTLTLKEKSKLIEALHIKEVNLKISEHFRYFNTPKELRSLIALRDLSDVVKNMITESLNDRHEDYKIINSILTASHNIYTKKDEQNKPVLKKKYLTELINSHGIFKEASKWKYWISKIIDDRRKDVLERKIKALKLRYKREAEKEEKQEENAKPGLFG
jgi:hypothetical protein